MTEIHPWNVLSKVPYADHIEKKGNLSYISWASGWSMVKERYPEATFHKHLFSLLNKYPVSSPLMMPNPDGQIGLDGESYLR